MAAADTARLISTLELQDKFSGPSSKAMGSLSKLEGGFTRLGQTAQKGIGTAVVNIQKLALVGAGAAAGILVKSVQEASALNETVSKVGVVFDKSAASVLAWGETSATAMGLSKNEALGAAATYGNLLVSMGLTADQAASMSTRLVQLAGDLGSFNDMNPTEVLDKLRAGLTGESEPLKTLGVNINETILKAKALELGLIELTGGTEQSAASIRLLSLEVTDAQKAQADAVKRYGANSRQALEATVKLEKATAKLEPELGKMPTTLDAATKAQAAYALIFEQTKKAQGDFGRTSESLANRQRTLSAELKNTGAVLGTALLPKVAEVVGKFTKLVQDNEPAIARFAEQLPVAFDKAVAFAEKIPWESIGNGIKTAADFSGKLVDAFVNAPPEFQAALVALAGLNKLTGGAVGDIVGAAGEGIAKAFLQKLGLMNVQAGVVNVNAAAATGGGGGLPGVPAVGIGGSLAAIVGSLAVPVALAGIPIAIAAWLVQSKTITQQTAQANLDAQNNSTVNQGAGALGADWDARRRAAIETDNPGLMSVPQTSNEVVIGRNLRALEGLAATEQEVESLLRQNLAKPQPTPVFNFGLTAIVKVDTRDVATVTVRDELTSGGIVRSDGRIAL